MNGNLLRISVALLLFFTIGELRAAEFRTEDTLTNRIMVGNCILPDDIQSLEKNSPLGFLFLCLDAKAGAEAIGNSRKEYNEHLFFGEFSSSLYLTRLLSLHIKPEAYYIVPWNQEKNSLDSHRQFVRRTRYLFAQIGNPAVSKVRLTIGKMAAPFGVDYNPQLKYYQLTEHRQFWRSPENTARLTFDNLKNLQIDLGVSYALYKVKPHGSNSTTDTENKAMAMRIMADFPSLVKSRIIVSGYGDDAGEKKYGFGFINQNKKDEITQFEWVRIISFPGKEKRDFGQLLRGSYQTQFKDQWRWTFQYDDERLDHRLGSMGVEYQIWGYLIPGISVSYFKSEIKGVKDRWLVVSGVEVSL